MTTITRRFRIDAGHRVYGHEGKCAALHGHSFLIEVTVTAPDLDKLGRIVDFSVLKDRFGSWLEKEWDHGFLYWAADTELYLIFNEGPLSKYKSFKLPYNPTAENLSRYLLEHSEDILGWTNRELRVSKVVVWETENCRAESSL